MEERTRAVLYTDGGCKPSRGIGGWGVHGYLFDGVKPKAGTGQKDWFATPTGYVDARNKHAIETWLGHWDDLAELASDPKVKNVNVLEYVDGRGSLIPESTNNVAELTATTQALKFVVERNRGLIQEGQPTLLKVLVVTDSKYVQKGLSEWVVGWERNNWVKQDGEPVANAEHWQTLVELKKQVESQGTALTLQWIKGHAGEQDGVERDNLGNSLADHYASQAIIAGRKGEQVLSFKTTPAKGYWKPKVELNRLFAHSRWYFNTNSGTPTTTPTGKTVYHLGTHGKDDDFLGKRMSDASFAVLFLGQPEPALEKLREHQQREDTEGNNSIMISRLDFVFNPKVYPTIESSGGLYLQRRSEKLDLFDATDLQITKELRPPRLAFNLVDVMGILESLLERSVSDQKDEAIQKTDITSTIYELEESKKGTVCKINPKFTSAVKSLTVSVKNPIDGNDTNISLTFGMDLPHRNALAALAPLNPKLSVIAWKESKQAFRFATVVEVGEDQGIFAGFYSNIHLLT